MGVNIPLPDQDPHDFILSDKSKRSLRVTRVSTANALICIAAVGRNSRGKHIYNPRECVLRLEKAFFDRRNTANDVFGIRDVFAEESTKPALLIGLGSGKADYEKPKIPKDVRLDEEDKNKIKRSVGCAGLYCTAKAAWNSRVQEQQARPVFALLYFVFFCVLEWWSSQGSFPPVYDIPDAI